MTQQRTILVIGATGHVGRHLVPQLMRTGAAVRALTRNPESAGLPGEVDAVRGDLSDPVTLEACLDGVEAVYLIWPLLTAEAAPAVLEVVRKHARRIVYQSAMTVRDDLELQPDQITQFHAAIERLIETSGLEWTFLRNGGFATNTLGWGPQIRADGVVRWPYRAAARSLIHERDIAAVAARVLTGDGHGGANYVLTGPQALTQVEQVHIIGEAIGRPLRFEEISREAARQQMTSYWPPSLVDSVLDYWAGLMTEPEQVTSTVEEITGAPAHTFGEWAIDHVDGFRWPSGREVARTTEAVAHQYVSLFRQGKVEEAMRLLAADIVCVEPAGVSGTPAELRGIDAVAANSRTFTENNDIHAVEVDGPFVGDGQFAVRFALDTTFRPTGKRTTITRMSLYTVEHEKVVREEVYYNAPPPPAQG